MQKQKLAMCFGQRYQHKNKKPMWIFLTRERLGFAYAVEKIFGNLLWEGAHTLESFV